MKNGHIFLRAGILPLMTGDPNSKVWSQHGGQRWVGWPLGVCLGDWGAGGRSISCLLAQNADLTLPASTASSFQISFLGPLSQAYWADSFCIFPKGQVKTAWLWPSQHEVCPAGVVLGCPSQAGTSGGSAFISPAELHLRDPIQATHPLEYICVSGSLLTYSFSDSLKASVKILWSTSLSPWKSHYK